MADESTVARPYARAIFEIAKAAGELAGWSNALGAAAQVVEDEGAARFLARPDLTPTARASFVAQVSGNLGGAELLESEQGRNLLGLLAQNDRLAALPEIAARLDELKAREEKRVKVTLITAAEVEEPIAEKVTRALEQRLGRAVELELAIDPSIIGGAVVRAEDMVIDGSVASRLQRLTDTLIT